MISEHQIVLFRNLFAGRTDVFAIRWEKGGKSGYMPASEFDRYAFQRHRIGGGTFQNFSEKRYKPLTDKAIERHLSGEQQIGIYPLLIDNTSWFIAADFDKENWATESQAFIKVCEEYGLSAHLERSRSGNGGHVWIFFDNPYPAYKSRKLLAELLLKSGAFSVFEKDSSFDRLFPNQDSHSGKGLGNLIALPLFKPALEKGNSCFVDVDTLRPFDSQWEYLNEMSRTPVSIMEKAYQQIDADHFFGSIESSAASNLTIDLANDIKLNRSGIPLNLINFLKEELNFPNTEFLVKKKLGKNTWGIERYFRFVEEKNNKVIVPRGMIGKLLRFCSEQNIIHEFRDRRSKHSTISFSAIIQLRTYQNEAAEAAMKKDFGVIVAPPGSGKTVVALYILTKREQPSLIIVHRKQLADQWIQRIETFLGIPKREVGSISAGKIKLGKLITVATIQTLNKITANEFAAIEKAFGSIIVDECHHVPAQTYRNTISRLHAFYLYGLTATPFRKYNDGKLIFIHLGEVVAEIKPQAIADQPKAKIIVKNTNFFVPFNPKTDKLEALSKMLIYDSARNKLILDDVASEVRNGRRTVIITERKDHIETLNQFLKQSFETVTLSGEDSDSFKKEKWNILNQGEFQILITTGQYFGEGSDIPNVNCLFLAYPFSFEGKLVQYIGRVQRSLITPIVYDYRDSRIKYLENLFQKRNLYYKKLHSEGTLFDQTIGNEQTNDVEESIKIPLDQLEFRYGLAAFRHRIEKMKVELEFEIENQMIRPEFDVLKPYFAKAIRSKFIRIDLIARFKNGEPLSQIAFSSDLDKISRHVIDSVKFTFVRKNILSKKHLEGDKNLLNIDQVQGKDTVLFNSGEEFLQDILKRGDAKHFRQLQYLAEKHLKSLLKLRFVLMPFSFVFLLAGENQYHVVWETLDTEEATFIWHIGKDKDGLRENLRLIDKDLGLIRSKGRQLFFETNTRDVSRLIHDYSDPEKGFILWRDQFEERLT